MVCACVCSSPESEADLPPPSVQKLSSDLRPLMFWMSNATELLNFFQVKVEAMEKEWEFEGEKKKTTTTRNLSQSTDEFTQCAISTKIKIHNKNKLLQHTIW